MNQRSPEHQGRPCQTVYVELPELVEEYRKKGYFLDESYTQTVNELSSPLTQIEVAGRRLAKYPECPRCGAIFWKVSLVDEAPGDNEVKIYYSGGQCDNPGGQSLITKRGYKFLPQTPALRELLDG